MRQTTWTPTCAGLDSCIINWKCDPNTIHVYNNKCNCFDFREISILGLLLIAIGTGGIKPCVSAFGGDQFKLPQQQDQLAKFFSIFYFSINAGSLISTLLTPVLRENVKCFGVDSCFPLAFGVPGILMIVSLSKFSLLQSSRLCF